MSIRLPEPGVPVEPSAVAAPPRILSTKLYPPRLRANLVPRSRLISRLMEDPERRITVIAAPAGYGKSTLVAQWLAQETCPSGWITLDEGDNTPRPFFRLIVSALQQLDPGLATGTARLLDQQRPILLAAPDRADAITEPPTNHPSFRSRDEKSPGEAEVGPPEADRLVDERALRAGILRGGSR